MKYRGKTTDDVWVHSFNDGTHFSLWRSREIRGFGARFIDEKKLTNKTQHKNKTKTRDRVGEVLSAFDDSTVAPRPSKFVNAHSRKEYTKRTRLIVRWFQRKNTSPVNILTSTAGPCVAPKGPRSLLRLYRVFSCPAQKRQRTVCLFDGCSVAWPIIR